MTQMHFRHICLFTILVLSVSISGCSGDAGPTKVLAEGIHDNFLRIELEPPFETNFVSCRKRAGGNGVDLFVINDKSLIKGDEVPAKLESGRLLIDLDWSLFGDGKKEVWLDGIDKLGEWKTESPEE